MLFKNNVLGDIEIFTICTAHFSGVKALKLREQILRLTAVSEPNILIDCTAIQTIDFASIATFLNIMKSIGRMGSFSLCGLKGAVWAQFEKVHLDRVFTIYSTRLAALQPRALGPLTLTDKKALILSAGKGTRARPLSFDRPKPMFDVLGKPILHHCIDHLKSFGVRNIAINTSFMPQNIEGYFGSGKSLGVQVTYSREGTTSAKGFKGQPVGSAASMVLIQQRYNFFDDDFFVLCGDAISDLDLNRMMRVHKRSGAIATIATQKVPRDQVQKYGVITTTTSGQVMSFQEKPHPDQARSQIVNCGIYIFSPKILQFIPAGQTFDIGADLLPKLIKKGQHIQVFESVFTWTDIGCIKDYYLANEKALGGSIGSLTTSAQEIRPNVWAEKSAVVSPLARFNGPAYIGHNSVIERNSTFSGVNIIGKNCLVNPDTFCRDSAILDNTVLLSGAKFSGMCAGPNWCVRHSNARGEVTEFEDARYVSSSSRPYPKDQDAISLRA